MTDWAELCGRLGLREDQLPALRQARQHSENLLERLGAHVEKALSAVDGGDRIVCCAAGSLGRLEASRVSDIDLYFFCRQPDVSEALQDVCDSVRRGLVAAEYDVSEGGYFAKIITDDELCSDLGAFDETKKMLTARVLLLGEVRALHGDSLLNELRQRVFGLYEKSSRSRGQFYLGVANDLARYWRTLCVDYIYKVEDGKKAWAIRNIKLRSFRKLWHFANVLTFCAVASSGKSPEQARDLLIGLLPQPPLERIAFAREILGEFDCTFLRDYDYVAGELCRGTVRKALESVKVEDRGASAEYQALRKATDALQVGLTELIVAHASDSGWGSGAIRQFMF